MAESDETQIRIKHLLRKGKRMSRRNITVILMVITMAALSLSACGKNKDNTTDNNQKVHSESSQESVSVRDSQISPDGETRSADEKKSSQENTSSRQVNNIDTELQPVSIIPESTGSDNGDTDKNVSEPDSANSGNDKPQGSKTDPIELPFVPAY